MAKIPIAPYVIVKRCPKTGQYHRVLHANGKKVDLGKARMSEIKFRRFKGK